MAPTKQEKKRKRSSARSAGSTPVSQKSQNQNTAPSNRNKRKKRHVSESPSSSPHPLKKQRSPQRSPPRRKSSGVKSSRSRQSRVSLVTEKKKTKPSGRKSQGKARTPSPESSPEPSPVRFLSPDNLFIDDNKHLEVGEHDVIDHTYKVLDMCGSGTFGRVYKVKDLGDPDGAPLALKVMQDDHDARQDAGYEREALDILMKKDPHHVQNVVRFFGHFEYHGHPCLIFELLGPSLYKFQHATKHSFVPFPMHQLSEIVQNVCFALAFLRKCKLTHTDIKTENIVFTTEVTYHDTVYLADSSQTLVRELSNTDVKLIDFGSAVNDEESHGTDISTRQYRAPEIILELKWDHSCDLWSVGCVMFEIYAGNVLFQAPTMKEQIASTMRILGPIPSKMLAKVPPDHKFFKNGQFRASASYRKSPAYLDVMSKAKPLNELMRDPERTDTKRFLDLLENFLIYDPRKRISAADALYHDFLIQRISRKRKHM